MLERASDRPGSVHVETTEPPRRLRSVVPATVGDPATAEDAVPIPDREVKDSAKPGHIHIDAREGA